MNVQTDKKIIIGIVAVLVLATLFFTATFSNSCAEENVSGWAWSSNLGWISFNNTTGGGGTNYGVHINEEGVFSGYAWSRGTTADGGGIGWITFNETDLLDCLSGLCRAWTEEDGKVYGWARAYRPIDSGGQTLGGWTGWISLRGSNYGVEITDTGEFSGFAWGGGGLTKESAVIGWISFKGDTYGVETDFAFSYPPYIETGSQQIDYENYCMAAFLGKGQIGFSWQYRDPDGDPQSRFDFRINSVNDVNGLNPEVDRTFPGLNNPDGTINSQAVLVTISPDQDELAYDTIYYWWARVWDDQDNNSGWVQGPNFNTPLHAYPWIDFSWVPEEPSIDEIVEFIDQSEVYGGAIKSSWLWQFPGGEENYECVEPETGCETVATTSIKFFGTLEAPDNKVYLTVTDSDGFSCTSTKEIGVALPLPEYREVFPVFRLKKMLAGIINFVNEFVPVSF